jgi:hypothetical protein
VIETYPGVLLVFDTWEKLEEFENTKGVIRISKLKDRQNNGQQK